MTNPLIAQAAAVDEDQTEDTGIFARRLIPAGPALARFIGYVEIGKRPQKPYKGKAKPDCMEVRFSFELTGESHEFVVGKDEEAGESGVLHRDIVGIKITKKQGERAGFVKLLKKMAYGRPDKLNFGSMLGEGFLINIVHNPGQNKAGDDVIWVNMKDESYNYLIGAPAQTDAISGATTVFDVPNPINPLRLLLWDAPTTEQWDSIFIDGTRTVKVDGVEIEESKNWLQRDIISEAVNFEGSPIHQMLSGLKDTATPMAGDQDKDADDQPNPPPPPVGDPVDTSVSPAQVTDEKARAEAQAIFDKLGV